MSDTKLIEDIFDTMADRYRGSEARSDLAARIGFDLGEKAWTAALEGPTCRVRPGLAPDCTATIRTSAREWIAISTGATDPTVSFLNKRLTVDGDLEILLEAFGLFDDYASEALRPLEPAWVLDTLGPHWGSAKTGISSSRRWTAKNWPRPTARRFSLPAKTSSGTTTGK